MRIDDSLALLNLNNVLMCGIGVCDLFHDLTTGGPPGAGPRPASPRHGLAANCEAERELRG